MAVTGKTGADAIAKAFQRICIVVTKYNTKLTGVIDLAQTAGVITSAEATTAKAFVTAAVGTCAIFQKIAGYSGF